MMSRLGARRHEMLLIFGSAVAVALLVGGFMCFEVWRGYGSAMSAAEIRSSNLARLLDEQTRRTVQAVDLSLLSIADSLKLAPDTNAHSRNFTRHLRSRLNELPYVRAFFVIGADGFIIQDTDADTPRINLADRDYFRVHQDPSVGFYIGQPLQSRSPGSPWFLSMSRRITLDDGTFYGVAVAAVEPRYFARFYSDISAGNGAAISLMHRQGLMVARNPDHENGVGRSFAHEALFRDRLPASQSGTYVAPSFVDGIERIFSYRLLDPYPLVVVVGLSKEVALQDWAWHAQTAAAATLALVLVLGVGAFAFVRQRQKDAQAKERLQQIEKAEALGRMTSSVAHDFNNLLTVASGNLDALQRKLPEADPLRRNLSRAMFALDRGTRLVRQLLAFARRQPLLSTIENPKDLLIGLEDLLRQAARPATLVLKCAPETWHCELDPSAFERAIMNLVVNARDAMPRSSVVIDTANVPSSEFDRHAWPELRPGDYVACRVSDDGSGMPDDVIRRAYEPFFTTKSEGQGTGLGLSQVYGFARQCGGGMKIESTLGAGTEITLLLPRSDRPPEQHDADTAPEHPPLTKAGRAGG